MASLAADGDRNRRGIAALTVLGLAIVTIAGAFAFQMAGYAPCELCLKQRWPYYAGIVVAALTLLSARGGSLQATRIGFGVLILLFLASAGLGMYHAGVEWGFWAGPADCTGTLDRASTNADFLHQLQKVKVVRCDAVAIRILGLSLAGWNVLVSLTIASVAAWGLRAR